MQKSGDNPDYYLQTDRSIRLCEIAEVANLTDKAYSDVFEKAKLEPKINNTIEFRAFHKLFTNLWANTRAYLKQKMGKDYDSAVNPILVALKDPDRHSPQELLDAYEKYVDLIVTKGILDIGYKGRSIEDRMFD